METMTEEPQPDAPPDADGFVVHESTDDVAPAPRPKPKRQPQRPAPVRPLEAVEREFELQDAAELRDQLLALSGGAQIKVTISRRAPKFGPDGSNVMGVLESVDDAIDHDYIRETWGGGTFSLMIQTLKPDGRYKIHRRIQLQLAGAPKMHGQFLGGVGPAPAPTTGSRDPMVQMAFESSMARERETQQLLREAERDRFNRPSGVDPRMFEGVVAPYVTQISELMATVRDLQSKLADQANKPPPRDEFRDALMSSVITGDRSEADRVRKLYEDRLQSQQKRYEDRMDDMMRSHREDLKRAEDRGTDLLRAAEVRHERELKMADKQSDFGSKNADVAFQARLEAQKETISRLERELTQAASKIGTLEAKKDQSIADKANELLSVQEALEGLGAGGGDKDEKWWSKALDVIGNSQAAMAVIEKFTGGSPADQQATSQAQAQAQAQAMAVQQQAQLPPPGVPWQAPDGNVYVRDAVGNVHQLDPNKVAAAQARLKKKKKKAKKAAAAADANGAVETDGTGEIVEEGLVDEHELDDDDDDVAVLPPGRPPKAEELAIAISFMENAIRGGAPAESFGATARNLVPADVLAYIMQFETIDAFLNQVKLTPGSPLTSVVGRRFARAVHKYLKEGST
jgi:hypothetical protein